MLGKRFQRTTSMAQIGPAWSVQPAAAGAPAPETPQPQPICQWEILKQAEEMMMKMMAAATGAGSSSRQAAANTSAVSDRSAAARQSGGEFLPRGTFLDNCFFCKRRLKHERDIFIYRGDAAFCTEECRQRHMLNDERSMTASKKGSAAAETAVAA